MNADICENSILVVAHPDDEILWFSSILGEVDQVILCYLGELVNPEFGDQRRQSLIDYPLQHKMACLELVSLGISRPRNFLNPQFLQDGIEFTDDQGVDAKFKEHYKENYHLLRNKMATILSGYQNVFTHNSWGEYGHEEHVQVNRVVRDLQGSLGFNLWTSNYCSTRTIGLMASTANASQVVTLPTNPQLAQPIMEIYQKTQCWTWYDDWKWPAEETFFKETPQELPGIPYGSVLPINLIVMPPLPLQSVRSESKISRLRKFVGLGKER